MEMVKNNREKKRYVRELLIMAFMLALVGLTVSYATVNATLDIAGISAVRVANWSIGFDSAKVTEKVGTAEVVQTPRIRGLNVHYEVKLHNPGDSITIKAVVKNRGNMDAKLYSYDVFGVPSKYEDNISYKVTDADGEVLADNIILKGENVKSEKERYMTLYITLTYDNAIIDDNNDYKVFDLGLALHFVQHCEKCRDFS